MADKTGYGTDSDGSDVLRNYHDIPEEDRRKAQVFFERGKAVADTGNYEYSIEMYIQGLAVDPENVDAHAALREIALKRKASGGKDMGMFERMKLPKAKDDKQTLLNSEKLLAYDAGNTDRMLAVAQAAYRAGFYDTVMWIGPIFLKANADSKRPDFAKFISLRDIYHAIGQFKLASQAAEFALALRPDDMNLQQDMKNLAAKDTMASGKYGTAKSFRESIRDRELQEKLLEQDKDVHEIDALTRSIREAEAAWQADPEDPGKFTKLIEALRRPEQTEYEDRAVAMLEETYQKTNQFRWRQRIGEIRMAQLARQERTLRAEAEAGRDDPDAQELLTRLRDFRLERAKTELQEFQLILEHYPTDSNARYQVAVRLFQLGRYQDAIPVFQQVRSDPKYRVPASILLGQALLLAGFPDEAVDTLKAVIDEYPGRGDERSMELFYWHARALEEKKDLASALKAYSQVVQWSFNYRDVQSRIKRLRGGQ